MIDFRFHIISLVAVFLSLTLGILLGSSVIQGAVVDRLRDDITRYREERDVARSELRDLREETTQTSRRLTDEVAPFAIAGSLTGVPVVVVVDGEEPPQWRSHVQDALTAAGAELAGTIALTGRWELSTVDDRQALARAASSLTDPVADASLVLAQLGSTFLEPQGRVLLDALETEGFVELQGLPPEGQWPPADSQLVVLSPSRRAERAPTPGAIDLVTSVGAAVPTLVVSDRPQGRSLVSDVRRLRDEEDLAVLLATFDSATDAADPGGVGVVAALVAASDARGGDFGADGSSFVAPPPAAPGE